MNGEIRNLEPYFEEKSMTDIEVALHFLRLIDSPCEPYNASMLLNKKTILFELAQTAIKGMTNPYARKLIEDRMTELSAP